MLLIRVGKSIRVKKVNFRLFLSDASLRRTSTGLGFLVMMLTAMSFLKSIFTLGGAVFVLVVGHFASWALS